MTTVLVAKFEKRYSSEIAIEADWLRPADQFSINVLFGPSGCGKTTVLRCLAGLERPEHGLIQFGDRVWFESSRRVMLTPQQRDIGFLFQDYVLFPHLTVGENIAYGIRGLPRVDQKRQVAEILRRLQLTGIEDRFPRQISGGEQQRVALARALVRRPRLLLLDEPLSALDMPTRETLRPELRRLLATFAIPVFVVTHDRVEALSLADYLMVMDRGKVRQQGSANDVFSKPRDLAVTRIIGTETVQPAKVMRVADGLATVALGKAELVAVAPPTSADNVHVCVRGEDVVLVRAVGEQTSARNRLAGTIVSMVPEGPLIRVTLDCGFPLISLVTRPACEELSLREGEQVTALIKVSAIHLIARD